VDPDSTQKTALYREVNATTEAMLKQFAADHAGSFLCECPDVGCDRRLALTYQEYEDVRAHRAYLVSLDCVGDADVIARTERYAMVEFRRRITGGPGPSRSGSSLQESSQRAWSRPARSLPGQSSSERSAWEAPEAALVSSALQTRHCSSEVLQPGPVHALSSLMGSRPDGPPA